MSVLLNYIHSGFTNKYILYILTNNKIMCLNMHFIMAIYQLKVKNLADNIPLEVSKSLSEILKHIVL